MSDDSAVFRQTAINPSPVKVESVTAQYKILRWRDSLTSEPFEYKTVGLPVFRTEIPVFSESVCMITRRVVPNGVATYPVGFRSSGIIELESLELTPPQLDLQSYRENQGHYLECNFALDSNSPKDVIRYLWRTYNGIQRGNEDFAVASYDFESDELALTIDFESITSEVDFLEVPQAYHFLDGGPFEGTPLKMTRSSNSLIWHARIENPPKHSKLIFRWKLATPDRTKPTYVFGYGSLISPASASQSLGRELSSNDLICSRLKGYVREWSAFRDIRGIVPQLNSSGIDYIASLNVRKQSNGTVNGALFEVSATEIEHLNARESNYLRIDVSDSVFEAPTNSTVYTYASYPIPSPEIANSKAITRRDYLDLVESAFDLMGPGQLDEFRLTTAPPPQVAQVEPDGKVLKPYPDKLPTPSDPRLPPESLLQEKNQNSDKSSATSPNSTAFISYASEDRHFATRLAEELRSIGIQVWFDAYALAIGDHLRRSIDKGLAEADYGIVILSQNYFAKMWPQIELDGLVQKEKNGTKVILPVWHEVTYEDVAKFSLPLADRVAARSGRGPRHVARELLKAMA